MKIKINLSILLLFLALLPCIAAPAGAASFTISYSGNGVFVLQGAGLTEVASIDVTISYDTATLVNPRVVQGGLLSGATMLANTNSPGVIRIGVISSKDIAGSGLVATISFDRPGGGSGKIISLKTAVTNSKGDSLAAQSQVINPVETNTPAPVAETPPTDPTTATAQPPRSTAETVASTPEQRFMGAGTITIPATSAIPGETGEPPKQQPAPEIPQEQPVTKSKGVETGESITETAPKRESPAVEPAAPAKVVYPSVLDRFREFKGKKTPKSLTALFDAAAITGVRQEPGIALTDGTTKVKVSIQIQSTEKEAPSFALKRAKLISLEKKAGAWLVEVLPDSKVNEAVILAMINGSEIEIPLTVALMMNADMGPVGNLGEAEFNLFLKERGTDKAPRFDLNGDGVRNYMDDYIFTANHIVKRDSRSMTSPKKQKR